MFKKKRIWCILTAAVLLIGGAVVWWWYAFHAGGGPPIFTISKETTYVTGPVLPSGHIDYVTALNERLSKGVSPENNAQVLLVKAIGPRPARMRMPSEYYRWLEIEEPAVKGKYFVDISKYLLKKIKFEQVEDLDENNKKWNEWQKKREEISNKLYQLLSKRPWKAPDHPHIAAWLKANEKPLSVVIKGTKRSQYFKPLIAPYFKGDLYGLFNTLQPNLQVYREIAEALIVRALLYTEKGDYERAWRDLLACHRLGRHVSHGATAIEWFVGVVIDETAGNADIAFLSHAKLSSVELKNHLKDIMNLPSIGRLPESVNLGGKFTALDAVMMVDRCGPDALVTMKKRSANPAPITGKVDWDPALRKINRLYLRIADACRKKDRKGREEEFSAIDAEVAKGKSDAANLGLFHRAFMTRHERGRHIGDLIIAMVMPAYRIAKKSEDRATQQQRNLHIAFALAAYRSDHKRYPGKLDQLKPNYLKNIPNDLFTGKPLVYCLTKDGYLLYSLGPNGVDDGGRDIEEDPSAYDIVVRMPVRFKATPAD